MVDRIPITFLITDLHLGGSPRVLRNLALGLANSSSRLSTQDSELSTQAPELSTQDSELRTSFSPSIISLKPLPAEELETGNSTLETLTIPAQLRAAGVPVHSLNLARLADLPRAIPRLATLLNTLRPAILYSMLIHANTLATLTLPFVKHKPIFIQSIHTLQPRPAWHWTLQGLIAPYADAIVVPAQPILEKIAQHGAFQRGIVIPNGIDLDRFANAAPMPASELPWPPEARVIGYVGRFDPVKNLPLLLGAFAKLLHLAPLGSKTQDFCPENTGKLAEGQPKSIENHAKSDETHVKKKEKYEKNREIHAIDGEIHLALVGYGGQEGELRGLAAALGIASRVHFLGPTGTPERWYKSFCCHCLPSSVEGFGLTLVEALAAGIPVVAIRTAVTAEVVGGRGDAILIDHPDEMLLANALQRVISVTLAEREAEDGEGGGVGRYSVREMVAMHERIFEKFSNF